MLTWQDLTLLCSVEGEVLVDAGLLEVRIVDDIIVALCKVYGTVSVAVVTSDGDSITLHSCPVLKAETIEDTTHYSSDS